MRPLLVTLASCLAVACGAPDGAAVQADGPTAAVAASGGGVTVDVVSTGPRTGGFYGAVRLTNTAFPSPITSFEVVFKMPGASVTGGSSVRGPDASGNFTATSPQTLLYQPVRIGQTYDLRFNGTGTFTSSTIVSLKVNGQTIPLGGADLPPTASLASSATLVTTASTVTLTATASDDRGVARVEFYEGGALLASDATSPYTLAIPYTSAANGAHTYTARAYDTANQATTSAGVTVTVSIGGGGGVSINAGGAAAGSFLADQYFSGGTTYSNSAAVDVTQLPGPPPASIFNTERYGAFSYTIPNLTPGAAYAVTLYFAETYLTAAGQRTFDVSVNGAAVLTAFDIFAAAGGANRGVARTFGTTASASGQVVIQFTSGVQNPKVNALTVAPAGTTDLPPTASLASSATTVTATGAVTLTATAADDVGVNRVDFFEGGTLLGSDTTAPYTHVVSFTSANNGTHAYTARAYDTANQATTSAAVTVTVNIGGGDLPPTASLTASATTVTAAGTVTLTAAASDDKGVSRVEFYEGSTLLASDTSAPYTHAVAFTSAANGRHTYTARAYDTINQVGTSAAVTVTVSIGGGGTLVSLIQSSKANATEITQDEVKSMVTEAVDLAGGLGFITNGMTVVLKPNLLTHLSACWSGTATLSPTVNGVTTDWRVVRAVAELVRARNPSGRILVMEGSARSTTAAFQALGYTAANFGATVDQFVALEGSGCNARDTSALVQRTGASGKQYWINSQYAAADVVISVAALKTHGTAGTTGCVKNLGIGSTPAGAYSASTSSADCTRNYTQSSLPSFITHASAATLGEFVADFYSVKPAEFAVMDGLQGMQNGPCSTSAADKMNMRLILASKNSVALDAVAARVMSCDPAKVPALTRAEAYGLGTIAEGSISVVGNKQIADVKKLFRSGVAGVCQ